MHVLEDVNPSLLQKKGGQRIESDACVVNHTCVALGGIACLADGMFFLTEISIFLIPIICLSSSLIFLLLSSYAPACD